MKINVQMLIAEAKLSRLRARGDTALGQVLQEGGRGEPRLQAPDMQLPVPIQTIFVWQ